MPLMSSRKARFSSFRSNFKSACSPIGWRVGSLSAFTSLAWIDYLMGPQLTS